MTFVVAPEMINTFSGLQKSVPIFFAGVKNQAEELFASNPQILEYLGSVQVDWDQILQNMAEFLKTGAGSMLSTTMSAAVSIVNGVSTFAIGFIFAIYILFIAALAERTFSSFLTGQCVEAVILGVMFFVALSILRLPYALLVGVLIAFTALIPIFGAFVGLGIGAFLMLMVNPMDALIFTITFFVLQQIEGNLIYPHVVGGSVGLPSIWVLVAVTVGGSMMGVVGMLLFIPLCSVLYALLREAVHGRLAQKKAHGDEGEERAGE